MDKLVLRINGEEREYPYGIRYMEIAKEFEDLFEYDIALVKHDDRYRELNKPCIKSGSLSFVTVADKAGYKAYRKTLLFMMLKAADDINKKYGIDKVIIENSIGSGLFCRTVGSSFVTEAYITELKARMHKLVLDDVSIVKRCINTDEAIELFKERGMLDKVKLFKYRRATKSNIYEMDGYIDYCYGHMLPSAGYVKHFDVEVFESGFVLNMPERSHPDIVKAFKPYKKLFAVQQETDCWGRLMGVENAGDLNDYITKKDINRLILIQEALQEKKIADIADDIYRRAKRIVLIAGPSSSGKTTFSHRLSIQLETLGLKPHPIAVDDYFINRSDMKPLPDNTLDFEALDAVDVELFNEHMVSLLNGERIELPTYNFKTGKREYRGRYKELGENDILVVEGIHCLNEKMSYRLPKESKYKIYISALTALNIDEHNRIPTTDARLLRRMVRDARTRGVNARETLERWPSVRRGEDNNIFPFQEDADAMFNSILIYELAVLKPYAEKLLYSVESTAAEYQEARNILKFLEFFVTISNENVPKNSILSEFIGNGCFLDLR